MLTLKIGREKYWGMLEENILHITSRETRYLVRFTGAFVDREKSLFWFMNRPWVLT